LSAGLYSRLCASRQTIRHAACTPEPQLDSMASPILPDTRPAAAQLASVRIRFRYEYPRSRKSKTSPGELARELLLAIGSGPHTLVVGRDSKRGAPGSETERSVRIDAPVPTHISRAVLADPSARQSEFRRAVRSRLPRNSKYRPLLHNPQRRSQRNLRPIMSIQTPDIILIRRTARGRTLVSMRTAITSGRDLRPARLTASFDSGGEGGWPFAHATNASALSRTTVLLL
jgi:hypothetical protein